MGVTISNNFSLEGDSYIDSRLSVADKSALDSLEVPEGFECYVEDESIWYTYTGTKWVPRDSKIDLNKVILPGNPSEGLGKIIKDLQTSAASAGSSNVSPANIKLSETEGDTLENFTNRWKGSGIGILKSLQPILVEAGLMEGDDYSRLGISSLQDLKDKISNDWGSDLGDNYQKALQMTFYALDMQDSEWLVREDHDVVKSPQQILAEGFKHYGINNPQKLIADVTNSTDENAKQNRRLEALESSAGSGSTPTESKLVFLTQSEYDSLDPRDPSKLYVIKP